MAFAPPQAKAALKALLEAHTWPLNAPDIRWGAPTEGEDFNQGGELIYFRDTVIDDPEIVMGAGQSRQNFTLQIETLVIQYGDDEQATEQRAWDLCWEVLVVLKANPTLSGTINALGDRTATQTNGPLMEQWVARVRLEQEVLAIVFL